MSQTKKYVLMVGLTLLSTLLSSSDADGIKIEAIGEKLPNNVVDIFVPPTRSEKPYVATTHKIFVFTPSSKSWSNVFDAGPHTSILDIEGYEKSSEPLYVATSAGISRTRDGGQTWHTSKPNGYDLVNGFGGLSVGATNRKEAVVATGKRAWHTQDFGLTWIPLPLPDQIVAIRGIIYVQGGRDTIALWDNNHLYWTQSSGKEWETFNVALGTILSGASGDNSFNLLLSSLDTILSIQFSPPFTLSTMSISVSSKVVTSTIETSGTTAYWISTDSKLLYTNGHTQLFSDTYGVITPSTLSTHPRKKYVAYFAIGNSVMRATATPLKEVKLSAEPLRSVKTEGHLSTVQMVDSGRSTNSLRQVLAKEPQLRVAVQAALRYADYDPAEVRKWRQNARRRNWLPDLKLTTGKRQSAFDVYDSINTGTPLEDDLHRSDREKGLDYSSIELRWSLRDLLFDSDQTKISEEARERATERNELIRLISTLYYERLSMLVRLEGISDKNDTEEFLQLTLTVMEATDLLNQLCGHTIFSNPVL